MVSVIIPNYNHASFLRERIESVLNQTYQDIEVIILDDKSTDNSKDIINEYSQHPKVKNIVYNKENSGSTFKQWNKGFNIAQGEYIWIAESDDIAHPKFLEKLMEAIGDDKKISLAASAITLIDTSGKEIGFESISKSSYQREYTSKQFIRENLLLGNHLFNASSAIFRKDVLANISQQYSSLRAAGDYLFWIEIANHGKIIEIPDRLDYFRIHSSSVTPRLFAIGEAAKEDYIVYSRLRELGYLSGLYRKIVIGFRIFMVNQSDKYESEEVRQKCLQLWKNETKTPTLDSWLFFIYGGFRVLRRKIRNIFRI